MEMSAEAGWGRLGVMSEHKDRLRSELTASMKARDSLRSSTLRMALSAVTNEEVAGSQARELTDEEVVGVLAKEAKKRREAAEAYAAAGREESAQKEQAEADILAEFLPEPLTDADIRSMVTATIADLGVGDQGMKAMGRVMGALTPRTKGRADGAVVSAEVRRQLSAG